MPPPVIKLTAGPGTHIWRKPHNFDFDNAPRHLLPPQPLSSFSRARVTISAHWRGRRDNAGLLLKFTNPTHPNQLPRYVHVGAEVFKEVAHDELHVSVVGCTASSDWSLHQKDADDEAGNETTVEVRVEQDPIGNSLFVYYLSMDADGAVKTRHILRELLWMFEDPTLDLRVEVGVYAATPTPDFGVTRKELVATFTKFIVD